METRSTKARHADKKKYRDLWKLHDDWGCLGFGQYMIVYGNVSSAGDVPVLENIMVSGNVQGLDEVSSGVSFNGDGDITSHAVVTEESIMVGGNLQASGNVSSGSSFNDGGGILANTISLGGNITTGGLVSFGKQFNMPVDSNTNAPGVLDGSTETMDYQENHQRHNTFNNFSEILASLHNIEFWRWFYIWKTTPKKQI